jgi:hypothetical protein
MCILHAGGMGGGMGGGMYGGGGMGGMGGGMGMNGGMGMAPAVSATSGADSKSEGKITSGVSFWSHGKTTDASVGKKIGFLEQKGLTSSEIAEVLRRVNPNSEEYQLVSQGLSTGKTASQSIGGSEITNQPSSGQGDSKQQLQNPIFPTSVPAVARFPTPSFTFPQHEPPHGMIAIAPGMYAYLPGAPPPGSHRHGGGDLRGWASVVWQAGTALAAVGAAVYTAKQIFFPNTSFSGILGSIMGPGGSSGPGSNSSISLLDAPTRPPTDATASSASPHSRKSSTTTAQDHQPDDAKSVMSSGSATRSYDFDNTSANRYVDRMDLDRINKLAATSREELLSKNVSEMKSEFVTLSDQLKTQSQDMTKAIEAMRLAVVEMSPQKRRPSADGGGGVQGGSGASASAAMPAVASSASSPPSSGASLDSKRRSSALTTLATAGASGDGSSLASKEAVFLATLNEVQASCSAKEFKGAVGSLVLYISNIFRHDKEEKYRRINMDNFTFKQRVSAVPKAHELLLEAGFKRKGGRNSNILEWTKPDENDTAGLAWKEPLLKSSLALLQARLAAKEEVAEEANSANQTAAPEIDPAVANIESLFANVDASSS